MKDGSMLSLLTFDMWTEAAVINMLKGEGVAAMFEVLVALMVGIVSGVVSGVVVFLIIRRLWENGIHR